MHIFLTGPKRVGKSTLLNTIAGAFPGEIGGFRTVRLNTYLPGRYSVHLLSAKGEDVPAEENLLFLCDCPGSDMMERFDRLGCWALENTEDVQLLVMDELGPHEAAAAGFQAAVRRVLEGDIPVLGVLQQADVPFLEEIARHPKVFLIQVTEENRNALAARAAEFLEILTERCEENG